MPNWGGRLSWLHHQYQPKRQKHCHSNLLAVLTLYLEDLDTLIVIGGGTLMDEAKIWRAHNAPGIRLIVIPSLWGSGAEVSPVAVLNRRVKRKSTSVTNSFQISVAYGHNSLKAFLIIWPAMDVETHGPTPLKAFFLHCLREFSNRNWQT